MNEAPLKRILMTLAVTASVVAGLAAGGCSQSMSTELPDLSPKSASSPRAGRSLSSAEQKKAIDEMIAKRDGAVTEAGTAR